MLYLKTASSEPNNCKTVQAGVMVTIQTLIQVATGSNFSYIMVFVSPFRRIVP